MEVPIEAPLEVKKKIAKCLQKSGALKRIERKIKMGMMVAIEEIRDPEPNPKVLEHKPFKKADPYELHALQVVYSYLSERNLTYTLSTLLEESCQNKKLNEPVKLLDIVHFTLNGNEEEDFPSELGESPQFAQNLHSKQSLDFMNQSEEEELYENQSFHPSTSTSHSNEGIDINKATFEKSPYIVSVTDL